jgi:SAM-dependent methyltransferase
VLDVACGTGYWTRIIATRASAITGCDLSPEVLALARSRQPPTHPADFVLGDVFELTEIPGEFDGAFVGFWWSHMLRDDVLRFLHGLHRRLPRGSRIAVVDNRYVAGSNLPIARTDATGNTYQRRWLQSGAEYEVLKNFPSPGEVRAAIVSAGGSEPAVRELRYYWYATYDVVRAV